eukprot:5163427-Pleurochrysis_carterae.AAC.1
MRGAAASSLTMAPFRPVLAALRYAARTQFAEGHAWRRVVGSSCFLAHAAAFIRCDSRHLIVVAALQAQACVESVVR